MSDPFAKLPTPTLEQLGRKLVTIHAELRQLQEAIGTTFTQQDITIQNNNALTDQVLEALSLQVAYIMGKLTVTRAVHGGIADATGKIQTETKTFSQDYMESGRAKIVAQREEFRRAQGLSTESAAPAKQANGEAHDLEVSIDPASETTH